LIATCREFLHHDSAPGSDAGLCVAARPQVGGSVIAFGERAKTSIVSVADAEALAAADRMHLEPLTGTGIGVIGALAAVGLRAGGNDGRFLWLPGLREMAGVHRVSALRQQLQLDAIETEDGRAVADHQRVALGDWARPLLRNGRSVLIVRESQGEDHEWIVAAKERLKQLSD
jgi:hypothetical protein